MIIKNIAIGKFGKLRIVAEDGRVGVFDVSSYLESEAFQPLKDPNEFQQVVNGGYYVEWQCGADLSADTIEALWKVEETIAPRAVAESQVGYDAKER